MSMEPTEEMINAVPAPRSKEKATRAVRGVLEIVERDCIAGYTDARAERSYSA